MSDMHRDGGALAISARLKAAREAGGYSLDDIATRTRVPIRHLQHIDAGDWDQLPAITYTVGFVRSYANSVGLNGTELGAELRQHLGGGDKRPGAPIYEPADPARVPPRALAIGAGLLALLLAIGYLIWQTSAADEPDALELATAPPPVTGPAQAAPVQQPLAQAPQPAATGPVMVSATSDAWLRIYEASGASLFQGVMKAGQSFTIPPTAQAPQIRTGRPDAISVAVGQTAIPPLGAPRQTITNVSLRPDDLLARLRTPAGPAAGPNQPATAQPAAASASRPAPARAPAPVVTQAPEAVPAAPAPTQPESGQPAAAGPAQPTTAPPAAAASPTQ